MVAVPGHADNVAGGGGFEGLDDAPEAVGQGSPSKALELAPAPNDCLSVQGGRLSNLTTNRIHVEARDGPAPADRRTRGRARGGPTPTDNRIRGRARGGLLRHLGCGSRERRHQRGRRHASLRGDLMGRRRALAGASQPARVRHDHRDERAVVRVADAAHLGGVPARDVCVAALEARRRDVEHGAFAVVAESAGIIPQGCEVLGHLRVHKVHKGVALASSRAKGRRHVQEVVQGLESGVVDLGRQVTLNQIVRQVTHHQRRDWPNCHVKRNRVGFRGRWIIHRLRQCGARPALPAAAAAAALATLGQVRLLDALDRGALGIYHATGGNRELRRRQLVAGQGRRRHALEVGVRAERAEVVPSAGGGHFQVYAAVVVAASRGLRCRWGLCGGLALPLHQLLARRAARAGGQLADLVLAVHLPQVVRDVIRDAVGLQGE
mmetsp:Transcript_67930/g.178152  ORF Transcript_67930/g.178152 Transcript_67930/m.178152 type:complete len:436 (-) Transcript_67930:289-1596(-)